MDTPAQPADDSVPPRPTRRSWLQCVVRGAGAGVLLAFAGEAGRVLFTDNFHAVEPGKFYRCSQPSPQHLEYLVRAHGIRTVVNLRGSCTAFDWFLNECRESAALDICQEDLCFSAGRLPAVSELRRLVEVLDHAELPLLFHCQRGADRTGLASAVALLLHSERTYDEARRQLGLRYGHIAMRRTANLDLFFDLYEEWLARNGLTHSRDNFRRWAVNDYCPGLCRATIEALDAPHSVPVGEPFAFRVRCHNISERPWRFLPRGSAGVHVTFALIDDKGLPRGVGRAGLFEAEVAPGASIDLTLPLPALHVPGRYGLTVDLMDEQQCNFFQTGSEPLEWEFEVREQEAAAGG
jgi:Tyrosine phosphatase family